MLSFLLSPYGRLARKPYWLYWVLPYVGIVIAVDLFVLAQMPADRLAPSPIRTLVGLVLFWPSIAVTAKRLHDRGMTGWWSLAPFAAIVAAAVAAYWYYSMRMSGQIAEGPLLGGWTPLVGLAAGAAVLWLVLYPTINVLFLKGQHGANKYGPDPFADHTEVFT